MRGSSDPGVRSQGGVKALYLGLFQQKLLLRSRFACSKPGLAWPLLLNFILTLLAVPLGPGLLMLT